MAVTLWFHQFKWWVVTGDGPWDLTAGPLFLAWVLVIIHPLGLKTLESKTRETEEAIWPPMMPLPPEIGVQRWSGDCINDGRAKKPQCVHLLGGSFGNRGMGKLDETNTPAPVSVWQTSESTSRRAMTLFRFVPD